MARAQTLARFGPVGVPPNGRDLDETAARQTHDYALFMARPRSIVCSVALGLVSCTVPPTGGAEVVDVPELNAASGDPIAHLEVIAAPEMDGRGTPSVGLDKAIAYVVAQCRAAGLAGGMGDGVYEQPFTVGTPGSIAPASDEDIDGHTHERAAPGRTSNVVCRLPGSGVRRDVVMLSAHLDHLGHGFPGADDDGSGSAALLAMAHRFAASHAARPLERDLVFLWTTGEERGLLGSSYFVEHPPAELPLDRIAQVVNLDALGALEETRFSILPDRAAHTRAAVAYLTAASRELDPPFDRMNQDLDAYTRRTDAWSFVRKGVPTVWVFEGLTNPAGGGSLMPRYHRPTDTLENLLAENGGRKLRRMADMLTSAVERIASADLDAPN
jgi:hypothetical protein